MKHKTHVDTVLAFRARYLQNFDKEESSKRFLQYKEGVSSDPSRSPSGGATVLLSGGHRLGEDRGEDADGAAERARPTGADDRTTGSRRWLQWRRRVRRTLQRSTSSQCSHLIIFLFLLFLSKTRDFSITHAAVPSIPSTKYLFFSFFVEIRPKISQLLVSL